MYRQIRCRKDQLKDCQPMRKARGGNRTVTTLMALLIRLIVSFGPDMEKYVTLAIPVPTETNTEYCAISIDLGDLRPTSRLLFRRALAVNMSTISGALQR